VLKEALADQAPARRGLKEARFARISMPASRTAKQIFKKLNAILGDASGRMSDAVACSMCSELA
jgi:hypothetical protein